MAPADNNKNKIEQPEVVHTAGSKKKKTALGLTEQEALAYMASVQGVAGISKNEKEVLTPGIPRGIQSPSAAGDLGAAVLLAIKENRSADAYRFFFLYTCAFLFAQLFVVTPLAYLGFVLWSHGAWQRRSVRGYVFRACLTAAVQLGYWHYLSHGHWLNIVPAYFFRLTH